MAAIKPPKPSRAFSWVAGLVAFVLAVSVIATFEAIRAASTKHPHATTPIGTVLPTPTPQPITRTTAGAQVAWLWVQSQGQNPSLVAIDPNGRLVARLDESMGLGAAAVYGVWRSADGSAVFSVGTDQITAYSALDGKPKWTYARFPGDVVGDAFSPDGHWLAILQFNGSLQLQLLDLGTGASQLAPIARDLNATLPGMTCAAGNCASSMAWGLVAFAPDSTQLFTLSDWGGPARLTALTITAGKLSQTATAVDGQQGRTFPSCDGPAMAAGVIAGGQTLVTFCHSNGAVWFVDLGRLAITRVVDSHQGNPFWLSPIFTPDGHLLYLHQPPGFGDFMQVVDLATGKLIGPVAMPTNVDQGGPFAWLITDVSAGGVASTVPVSPDGLKLYSATTNGVMVLRVPDLKPLANLAPGLNANEVWISGDGHTIYALTTDGKSVVVMADDGSHQKSVSLPAQANGFVASEHG